MPMLLRLPLMLLELLLRGGASALKDLLRLLARGGDERPYVPGPEAEAEAAAAASARREPEHVSEEAEQVASFGPGEDPGSTVEVHAPWPGYDEHSAAEVIKRVRSGDEATRAVVLLYERTHKARRSVIAAAETSPT